MPLRNAEGTGTEQCKFEANLYESFMKRHLSHYGYYTGRNGAYRPRITLEGWSYGADKKPHSESEESVNDEDSDLEKLRTTQLVVSLESGRLVPRLKEPRHLFRTVDGACTHSLHQKARWPEELEMAQEAVKHLPYIPSAAEPFYEPSGLERVPEIKGLENGGQLVYELKAKPSFFFRQSRTLDGRGEPTRIVVTQQGSSENALVFESRFESGNLEKAIKVGEYEYELWLRKDIYTSKHTQWFYFKVANMTAGMNYRFTICNFTKSSSLYGSGMQPVMYSEMDARTSRQGWRRAGSDIKYFRTPVRYFDGKSERSYYALTFTVRFPHSNDSVYLAHCYPYTYTDLQDYLEAVVNDENKSRLCRIRVLCRSLAGNLVYLLTITSPADSGLDAHKAKKGVVLTARVHPGESNSSWMMKGLIDFLLGGSDKAASLREKFIFKVVPMLNPDGVIVGNYRCSLTGRDLNRNYLSLLKDSFPSIWHTRSMIQRLQEERPVALFCDLHGHSKKQNAFIYGCENLTDPRTRFHERVFPVMLSKHAPDLFSLDDCHFLVQKSKEGTGRIAVWNMGVTNSYTLEATFCGSTLGAKRNHQFTIADYESIGHSFCETLFHYSEAERSELLGILSEIREMLKKRILAAGGFGRQVSAGAAIPAESSSIAQLQDECPLADGGGADDDELFIAACSATLTDDSNDSGSDSSVSDGLPTNLEFMQKIMGSKQRRQKKRKEKRKNQKTAKSVDGFSKSQQLSAASSIIHDPAFAHMDVGRSEALAPKRRSKLLRRGSTSQSNAKAESGSLPLQQPASQVAASDRIATAGSVSFRLPRSGLKEGNRGATHVRRSSVYSELRDGYLEALDDLYLAEGLLSSQHLRNERDSLATEVAERLGCGRDGQPPVAPDDLDCTDVSPPELSSVFSRERSRALTWLPPRASSQHRRGSLTSCGSAGQGLAADVPAIDSAGSKLQRGQCLKQYPLPFDQTLDTLRVASYNAVLVPAQRRVADDDCIAAAAVGGGGVASAALPTATSASGERVQQTGMRLLAAYAGAATTYAQGARSACSSQQPAPPDLADAGNALVTSGGQQRFVDGEIRETPRSNSNGASEPEKGHKPRRSARERANASFTAADSVEECSGGGSSGSLPSHLGWRGQQRQSTQADGFDIPRALRHLLR